MTGYIARDKLTDTLRSHRNTPEIKVLTGVRRCGKSTLLEHYAQSLLDDGVPASNIFTVASIPSTRPSDIRRPTCTPT